MNKEAFDLLLNNAGGKLATDFAKIQQQQDANSLGARFGRTASGITSGARAIGSAANAGIQSARQGVRGMQASTNNALAGVRGGVDQMTANMQGRPATPAAAPQSYAQRGIPSSAQAPAAAPTPPQYFSVNRPQAPGPVQGPGMRQAVTSFDQLPPEFQARFRERLAGGSVVGANEADAVASYNKHYGGTARQLQALQGGVVGYGSRGRRDRAMDGMAGVSPAPGSMYGSRLPSAGSGSQLAQLGG